MLSLARQVNLLGAEEKAWQFRRSPGGFLNEGALAEFLKAPSSSSLQPQTPTLFLHQSAPANCQFGDRTYVTNLCSTETSQCSNSKRLDDMPIIEHQSGGTHYQLFFLVSYYIQFLLSGPNFLICCSPHACKSQIFLLPQSIFSPWR